MDAVERLDIDKTLQALTLEEKLRLLTGDGMWHTFAAGELPRVRASDGPNGLRMTEGGATAIPATCFPTPSMLANSWDLATVYNVGAAIGREATALGVNLLYAPGINIKRSPLGGRNFEYYSEDPLLSGLLGKAFVEGVQSTGVGACLKHFAANNRETFRMYSDSVIDERTLHELYITPFELALEAEPAAVMCAYNKLNGTYCSENEYLLKDILRDGLGYKGVTVSDYGAVHDRARSLSAGLDLEMPESERAYSSLLSAYERGEITVELIDASLKRLLEMIDNVYLEPYGDFDADRHDRTAYCAALDCIVLLKNENGFLPLTKDMRVAVMGTLAETAPIQGGGSSHVTPLKSLSPLDAFSSRAVDITYYRGYSPDERENARLYDEAMNGAVQADAIVVYVGADAPAEGLDRKTLELPPEQNKLISGLTNAGHRVVVVLCGAGPVLMPWHKRVRSIVYQGLCGAEGALAAVDVLYGRVNPRGKLAETFPAEDTFTLECDKTNKRDLYREAQFVGYRYYDATGTAPLFPFGHGLSFSEITYDALQVRRDANGAFTATVTLTNKSTRDANEIVQIYVSDRTGRVLQPKKQLAGFVKAFIEGQTSTEVAIKLDPRAFRFWNTAKGGFSVPDGEFRVMAARSAMDIAAELSVKVTGDFTDVIPYPEAYARPVRDSISDADFIELLGGADKLPSEPPPAVKSEFTLDSSLSDIRKCFAGRIAKRIVLRRAAAIKNATEREAFIANAMNTPLGAVASMSDGDMTLKTARGIIEMANGRFFKGVATMLKKDKKQ